MKRFLLSGKSYNRQHFSLGLILTVLCSGLLVLAYASKPITRPAKTETKNVSAKTGNSCPTCSPGKLRTIYAPLFDLAEARSSEIVLNSRSDHDVPLTPTFYTLDGEQYVGETIVLHPAEIRFLNTKSLTPVAERNRHQWGAISFTYFGGYMEAWAQLTLHKINGGGSANVLFTVMTQPRSNTSDAVWWVPKNGMALIALGNSSDQTVHATLMFSNGEMSVLHIRPFNTEVLRLTSSNRDRSFAQAEAVNVSYVGPSGSLIPTGFTSSADGKFVSMIRFYDTQHAVQQNLYANNLHINKARPRMVLKNVSSDYVTASPSFITASGRASEINVPTFRLAPQEVKEVDLGVLTKAAIDRTDFDAVSVKVLNSGQPGSLIGALYSSNTQTGITYDVPLRDSGPVRASTGGYPIRLDGDYTTTIAITNNAEVPGAFTMQINYEGGHFVTGIVKLEPGATKTFDIRKMRDEKITDVNGHPLPANLQTAQARWSVRGNVRLNGRSEVVSVKRGVSSSYSCFLCCPNTFYYGWITPDGIGVLPNGTQQFTAMEQDTNGMYCGGDPEPFPVGGSWYSSDTDVATVDGGGEATGISGGTADIECQWTIYRWEWDEADESCNETVDTVENSSPMRVIEVHIQFTGSGVPLATGSPPAGGSAYVTSVTMHATSDFAGGQYHWSTTSNKVTLSNADTDTVTVTSVSASSTRNDVPIKVTLTVGDDPPAENQINTTVQQPAKLTFVSVDSSGNETCSSGSGKFKNITWQLQDHLNPAANISLAIPGSDTLPTTSGQNGCGLTLTGTDPSEHAFTNSSGTWSHHYHFCTTACSCTTNGVQKYFFNGFEVDLPFTFTCSAITVDGH